MLRKGFTPQDDKLLHIEGKIARYTSRDVIVQKAIRAGEEAKLFTEIQNVRCESRKSDEKDNEKQCFPFMKRSRDSHERFFSAFLERVTESKVLSRVIRQG